MKLRSSSARCSLYFILLTMIIGCESLSSRAVDPTDSIERQYCNKSELKHEVDSLANPIIESHVAPGLVVGVLLPSGEKLFFGYGIKGTRDEAPPNKDTLFPIGSISKLFTAAITSILVSKHTLDWHDRVGEIIPKFKHKSVGQIELIELASHTSGLPRLPIHLKDVTPLVSLTKYVFTGENLVGYLDKKYVYEYLLNFNYTGSRPTLYSILGYGLMGEVLQEKTGETIPGLFKNEIATNVDLANTGYGSAYEDSSNRAYGHAGDQPKLIARGTELGDWSFTPFLLSTSAMYSSAKDLLTFAAAHVDKKASPILYPSLKYTLRIIGKNSTGSSAISWFSNNTAKETLFYQVGFVAGYSSYLGINSDRKIAVVVLQNGFNWTDMIGERLLIRLSHTHWQTDGHCTASAMY